MIKKILLNNLKFKIIAVVLAIILWAVVVNATNPTVTQTVDGIPVTIINESEILDGTQVYKVVSGSTASVTITGSRSNVFKVLKPSAFEATADFSEVSVTGTININVGFAEEYKEYSKLLTIKSNSKMTIELDPIESRDFTPEIQFVGTPAEGFEYDAVIIDPEIVSVYAPSEILKSVCRVVLIVDVIGATADLNTVVEPVIYDYSGNVIEQNDQIKTSVATVNVSAGMIQSTDVILKARATGTVGDGYAFEKIIVSPETVKLKGEPEKVAAINEIDLGEINISGATGDVEKKIDLMELLPEGTALYDEADRYITVTAKISELTTKNIILNEKNISFKNIPSTLNAKLDEDVIVVLKGPQDILDKVTAASLLAYVDLSGAKEGTGQYTVAMTLPVGVTTDGAKASISFEKADVPTSVPETETSETESTN